MLKCAWNYRFMPQMLMRIVLERRIEISLIYCKFKSGIWWLDILLMLPPYPPQQMFLYKRRIQSLGDGCLKTWLGILCVLVVYLIPPTTSRLHYLINVSC